MNSALLWFAVLYGEITAAVLMVVAVGYWVETPTGASFCNTVGLAPLLCQGALDIVILAATFYAGLQTFRRFVSARKKTETSQDSDSPKS